jgi:hypothetical protein
VTLTVQPSAACLPFEHGCQRGCAVKLGIFPSVPSSANQYNDYMEGFINSEHDDLEELRARLRRMSDSALLEFGQATKALCRPGSTNPDLPLKLKAAQAEWQRRHPNKVKVTRSEFEKQASDAMLNHVLRRTVGVINEVRILGRHPDGRRADQEVPGTGCPVLWDENYLILTARHVVDTATVKNIRIAASPQTAILFKEPERLTPDDMLAGEPLHADSRIVCCEWEDLAAIIVPSTAFPKCDFVDVQQEWVDPVEGELVHCCGFPTDHNVTADRKMVGQREEIGIAVYPTVFNGKVLPQPSEYDLKFYITDFDPSRHYLIPYACSGSKHPRGVSGAAIWLETDQEMLVWRPEFKFAGTCVCTYRNGTILQVIKASVVRNFLKELS